MIGNSDRGFTLIELMVVLLLVSILAAVVAPQVINSIEKAKEAALREDLYVIRKALDDYHADLGHYPVELEHLVEAGYIRALPLDPFTQRRDLWQLSLDAAGGVMDLHSSYEGVARDGSEYSQW